MNRERSSQYVGAYADPMTGDRLSRGSAEEMRGSERRDPHKTSPKELILDPADASGGIGSHSLTHRNPPPPLSQMTVASFVEHKFAPEHINLKRYPSRLFYQAILKHVITPEEVERIFQMNPTDPRKRLKSLANWPYLNEMLLRDVRHEHVSRIADAATALGYSVWTTRHIRNVIGTIFSHAIQEKCFFGDNPISLVKPIRRPDQLETTLTPAEARIALGMMRYPERELTIIGAITAMSPAEIIGLQWAQINMMEEESNRNGIRIPPLMIAVRKRLYRGQLDDVTRNSFRDVAIDRRLLQILMELRMRSNFTQPNDFVLVSHFGTPVSHDNIMTQRLRPIAKRLGVPSVSSRMFRDSQGILTSELDRTSPFRFRIGDQVTPVMGTLCEA